jgi:hypothetical protein
MYDCGLDSYGGLFCAGNEYWGYNNYIYIYIYIYNGARGSVVVKALSYRPEGRDPMR